MSGRLIPVGIGLAIVAIAVVYIRGAGMPLWKQLLWSWAGNGLVLVLVVGWSMLRQGRGDRVSGRQANMPRIAFGATAGTGR